jgi:hypothetical protein
MVEIGNNSVTVIRGQVNWSLYSDQRIKDNITENVPGLDFITRLRPVTYNLNIHRQDAIMNTGKKTEDYPGRYDIEKIKMTGFVAQEVEKAAMQSGYDFSGLIKPKNENDLYSLRYAEFVVPLVKAIQEQQQLIQSMQKEIDELKQKKGN